MSVRIRKAQSSDLPGIMGLLEIAGLPREGVEDHIESYLVAAAEDEIVGSVGLEVYDDVALLRSLVVREDRRKEGLGARLVKAILSFAQESDLDRVYLLTTTAEHFFPRFGFRPLDRSRLDPRLGASAELRGACPETAVCMHLPL